MLIPRQRSLRRVEVGRKRRSKSAVRSTLPTTLRRSIVWSPSRRSPALPTAATTSSHGRDKLIVSGAPRAPPAHPTGEGRLRVVVRGPPAPPPGDPRQHLVPARALEVALGVDA